MRTLYLCLFFGVVAMPCVFAQSDLPEPKVANAVDGVLDAFAKHPVVAISDIHGMAQEEDFYAALVRSPRFASEVGNVVVEFGDAAQQQTLDRYLSGEDVPYAELRKVWEDTVGWLPTVVSMGYVNFYATVREVNRKLKPEQQIHVWLGDPAVDWAQVKTKADLPKESRDLLPSEILKSLLAKGKKALLIYGAGHYYGPDSITGRVDAQYPGSVLIIHLYSGFREEACSTAFEAKAKDWGRIALVSPVRGSSLETRLKTEGCHFLPPNAEIFPPNFTAEQKAEELAKKEAGASGLDSGALLYLGPAGTLTQAQEMPDLYIDLGFRKEIVRRAEIMLGRSLKDAPVNVVPTSPRYVRPYGGTSAK